MARRPAIAWRDSWRRARSIAPSVPPGAAARHRVALFANPRYQAAFRNTPSFAELEELAGLLRDKLQGRPVELVLPTPDDPMSDPELLYFFGGFRSVSGITSPRGSIWTKSNRDAWIAKVLGAKNACVSSNSRSLDGPLFRAWNDAKERGREQRGDRRQAPLRRAVLQGLTPSRGTRH